MSYCRPSEGDIYLYPTGPQTAECQMCPLLPFAVDDPEEGVTKWWSTFRAESREEAFWHVVAHIENGDACGDALHRLYAEATLALSLG